MSRRKTSYQELKRLGICCDCGGKAEPEKGRCRGCLDKAVERARVKRRAGICPSCGNGIEDKGKMMCRSCRRDASDRWKARWNRRVSDGLCGMCGKHPIDTGRSESRCVLCLDKEKEKSRKNKSVVSDKNKKKRWALRIEVLKAYGGKCACCGEAEPRFLSIDHIDGGGTKHREQLGGSGDSVCRWLKKSGYPSGFQVLCHNCNQGRAVNGGICPHKEGVHSGTTGYKDDEESDGTPFAHPAYWRGEQHGVWGAVMRIRQVIDGKDNGSGVIGDEKLESLRRDILETMKRGGHA